MSIKNQISKFFSSLSGKAEEVTTVDCPNCWGREEYDGVKYQAVVNQTPTVKSGKKDIGWIQEYTAQYLSHQGRLKKDQPCPKCRMVYMPS